MNAKKVTAMIDLTQLIPAIKALTPATKLKHIETWERNLSEWQETLNERKLCGFPSIDTYLERIEHCQLMLKLLREE